MNDAHSSAIAAAADVILAGNLLGLPTETVYGLAANACDAEAVLKIFSAKQRPHFDPLIIHVADSEMAWKYCHVNPAAKLLAAEFWPGPMSLVLPKKDMIPDEVTSGLNTVAVRCPDHDLARACIQACGLPLAAPSANSFGRISPTTAQHVRDQLAQHVAYILDGGVCRVGVESTVISCVDNAVEVLRPGGLSIEAIEACLGQSVPVVLQQDVQDKHLALSSPGMLDRHYAPRIPLRLKSANEDWPQNMRYGYMSFSGLPWAAEHHQCLSAQGDVNEAAHNLFAAMRVLEAADIDMIIAEHVPQQGLGIAVNDRLSRAAHA
ncbi:MAG: threonylcarbamoyl-AMP synthase [Planctomycetes bacterium]|nr:threonylcarbamoyl-AMP synthase [Planctomycetota bacterium]